MRLAFDSVVVIASSRCSVEVNSSFNSVIDFPEASKMDCSSREGRGELCVDEFGRRSSSD